MVKILIDSSNVEEIEKINKYYKICGLTTNPSILAKDSVDLRERFLEIKNFVGDNLEVHVQTTENTSERILEEAKKLKKFFGNNFYIKIPITKIGLEAVRLCKENDIKVTVTAVLTTLQVLAACEAGANYIAPYVNRMENIGVDSKEILHEMVKIVSNYDSEILAASFKNQKQFKDTVLSGVGTITVQPQLLEESIWHPYTDKSILDFERDWENKFINKKVTDFID